MKKYILFLICFSWMIGHGQVQRPDRGSSGGSVVETDPVWIADSSDYATKAYVQAFAGGDAATVTEITYSNLTDAIEGKELTAGGWYLLTDFQTVHYFTDGTSPTYDLVEESYWQDIGFIDTVVMGGDYEKSGNYWVSYVAESEQLTLFNSNSTSIPESATIDSITFVLPAKCYEGGNGLTIAEIAIRYDESNYFVGELNWVLTPDEVTYYTTFSYSEIDEGTQTIITPETFNYGCSLAFDILTTDPDSMYVISAFANIIVHYTYMDQSAEYAINTGAIEPLLLLATSDSTVDTRVYSPSFPQDVLHYDWNPDNWLNDISFSAEGNIVAGWKGIITYRWDTKQDNSTGYDFRNVMFRRWAIDEAGSAFDDLYYSWNSTDCNGLGVDALDYDDFLTFGETYEAFWGNYIGSNRAQNTEFVNYTSILNNIVFNEYEDEGTIYGCYDNHLENACYWSTVGAGFGSNTVGAGFGSNTVGAEFQGNTVGTEFQGNTVGTGFGSNTVGTNFNSNTVGDNFYYNTVGDNFYYNTVGTNFNSNTVGAGFNSNTVGDNATLNTFHDGIQSTDFTAEPLMSAGYTVEVKVCSDASVILEYIDCTGTPTVTLQAVTPPE